MAQSLVTFLDIYSSVLEKLGVQSSDTLAINKIKRMVNEYYLDEVVPYKNWQWLQQTMQVVHQATYKTGTVTVANGSVTATLSPAPSVGLGSFLNFRFAIGDSDQVYFVGAHTAGNPTITLTTPFQEPSVTATGVKIWRDRFDLPQNARETVTIWHNQMPKPLLGVGPQTFREFEIRDPILNNFPTHYNTYEFFDPASEANEEDANRFRQTRIWPSVNNVNVLLNVDYIVKVDPLNLDTDEPLMPIYDRVVLFYGACAAAYSAINRNEDMHDRFMNKANTKLARMAAMREEGQDTPKLSPTSRYINNIRRNRLGWKSTW